MSDTLQVALIAEGPTDLIVIKSALRAMLADRPFVPTLLQPEGSLAFGETGTGWGGVYRWCKRSAQTGGGSLAMDGLLDRFDVLIIHVDADVAGEGYAAANISPDANDLALPCEQPCPPAADTTERLRAVVLSWCGAQTTPAKVVLCVPSKSMEAWVVASLFPKDAAVNAATPFECCPKPEVRLDQQPKKHRIHKKQGDYRARELDLMTAWPGIAASGGGLGEAHRFQCEMLDAVAVGARAAEDHDPTVQGSLSMGSYA